MSKVTIIKSTAEGEQLSAEIEVTEEMVGKAIAWPDKHSLLKQLAPYIKLFDDRLLEMNTRLVNAFGLTQLFPPEYRGAFRQAMDALHHNRPDALSTVAKLIEKDKKELGEARPDKKPEKGGHA